MAPYESDDMTTEGEAGEPRTRRRRAARYVVPVTVMGVAAATIGLVPALADSGDPDLPEITAAQLIEKIAKSDVERFSGTVKITTDLGLPDLGGLESGLTSGAAGRDGDGGSSADPSAKLAELASGTHTLRVAADGPDRQKVSLLENAAEYSLIHNGTDVWGYDSASNEVYHGTVDESGEAREQQPPTTPDGFAEEALKAVDDTTSVTVDGTAQVAGRDAYKLVVKPRQSGSTVGAISIAVDHETGVPLKFTLTPSSGGAAVVDVGFTKVSFDRPAASTFEFTPPKGAEVTEDGELDQGREHSGKPEKAPKSEEDLAKGLDGLKMLGEGWNSVAAFDTGGEGALPTGGAGGDLGGFLGSLGDRVEGGFGTGTVFSTRLVNALITEDGKVYAGAVTKDALVKAADAGK
ncbi:outer membrane lipoprotein carrier protein LolA [Streptomyces sp. NPDC000348]|uniref:LolA family protein n=1 Tax=Streptomyces sp. NPDC000348 TaxID=3364538 RepID=UPI0036BD558C